MFKPVVITITLLLAPVLVFAQVTDISSFMTFILNFMNLLTRLFMVLAVVLFFWGLVKFIGNASDTAAHEDGKNFIIWAIISFFVIASLWALVQFLIASAGVTPISQLKFIDKNGTIK